MNRARAFAVGFVAFARGRALYALAFALVALVATCSKPAPPARTVEGVAAMLGDAVGGDVDRDEFVWEARGGFLSDALLGRRVLFLAKKKGDAARDVYRARVRLTRSGRPIRVTSIDALTQTKLGDERQLAAGGARAAFATEALGAALGVTVLDLRGDYPARVASTSMERLRTSALDWIETGSTGGVERVEVTFARPPSSVKFELTDTALVLALGDANEPMALRFDGMQLDTGARDSFGARARALPVLAPSWSDLAVAFARAAGLPKIAHDARATSLSLDRFHAEDAGATIALGDVARGDASFPPRLPSSGAIAFEPWRSVAGAKDENPAVVVSSATTSKLHALLVALDLRQLDLHFAAGFADPSPQTGARGSGRPREGLGATIAAFAATPSSAFASDRATDDEAGAIEGGRVIVPPREDAPTIAVAPRRVAYGARAGAAYAIDAKEAPFDLLQSSGADDAAIARAAMGFVEAGHAIVAWSSSASFEDLSAILKAAGATWTFPLASAPWPTGVVVLREDGAAAKLASKMRFSLDAKDGPSPNGFFYVTRRDPTPKPAPANGTWAIDTRGAAAPKFLPSIFSTTFAVLGSEVRVAAFSPLRFAFRLRAGAKEPRVKAALALPSELSESEAPRLVAQIGLGTGKRKNARGLVVGGNMAFKMHDDAGVLFFDGDRARVELSRSVDASKLSDATELPLTADDRRLRPEARAMGDRRLRAAACVGADGTFFVATTMFDSDEATTEALLDVGCARVVALDRGSSEPSFDRRAGDKPDDAPRPTNDVTVLDLLDQPMRGAASPM